jgi:predicted RNA-binding protein with PIN domain
MVPILVDQEDATHIDKSKSKQSNEYTPFASIHRMVFFELGEEADDYIEQVVNKKNNKGTHD